ncbi:hypothetical protein FisN_14Hh159 [Fistulifera solaris]|uniref:Uncharacterized protein n=1 Tax=Fistulifera solaris TaxID=1519565 RepID=A0A1Z5K8J9_FISSO|nr:hypothetical protein FisN_14Hh159 [Fistulifera solaris]|eukprot:GAX22536.1 hypothetical protein FisN_14Hh159 [Fistulifera solaris]
MASIEATAPPSSKAKSSPISSFVFETYQRPEHEVRLRRNTDQRSYEANRILRNFVGMSLLFSVNHGCVVACLSLASARLGTTGNIQSGILYMSYTGSALLGATYSVKKFGPRDSLVAGLALYCVYVTAFWMASSFPSFAQPASFLGALVGGVGAGLLWTAQGAFFGRAAECHALALAQETSLSTSKLAGIFASIYLGLELVLRSTSSALLKLFSVAWSTIFGIYALLAIFSAVGMMFVQQPEDGSVNGQDDSEVQSVWWKITAALQLLRKDPKMRYMIGLNAVFGFASAFLNSYVNSEVVRVVLHDSQTRSIGLLSAWTSAVAATMSLAFGKITNKGIILTLGSVCFLCVAAPFLMTNFTLGRWNTVGVVVVYTLHGIGRATFEGTLKASFADLFSHEKEGAFANIILQNGLASAIGFFISTMSCKPEQRHCIQFQDGSFHDIGILAWMVVISALFAISGYWRADRLFRQQTSSFHSVWTLVENESVI